MSPPRYTLLIDEEKQDSTRNSGETGSSETLRSLDYRVGSTFSCSKIVTAIIWSLAIASLGVLALYTLVWPDEAADQFVPKFPTKPVTFEADHRFSSGPSTESNAAWDHLLPEGRGFVLVDNPELYGLGPGVPTELGVDRYSVSMFHQLHCLAVIRDGYYAAKHNHQPTILDPAAVTEEQKHEAHAEHTGHCFDYLRQAIMCAGDTTIEQGEEIRGRNVSTVSGWGITHQCRSWDDMVAWTAEHHAPQDHSGIL